MEKIEIQIQVMPGTEDVKTSTVANKKNRALAVYIDREQRVWGVTEEAAMKVLDSFEDRSKSEIIGKTDYILIYDAAEELKSGDGNYLMGNCLIMKTEDGLQGMTVEEIDQVMNVFVSRMTHINMGPFCIAAYELM